MLNDLLIYFICKFSDKSETTTSSTTTTAATTINNDIIPKQITEIDQNRIPWRPVFTSTALSSQTKPETTTETKSERLPAESNISIQSSLQPNTTEAMKSETTMTNAEISKKQIQQSWIPAMSEQTSTEMVKEEMKEEIPPVDATKSTGFESITKLPAGVTTPQGEIIPSEKKTEPDREDETIPTTTDYEITTIRFTYVPTEVPIESETESTTANWHPLFPTRTKITTIKDEPITTYRPQYMTTTDMIEAITMIPETTPQIEVSSQVIENETDKLTETTERTDETTTEQQTTLPTTTQEATEETTVTTLQEDTTIMVTEVVTEINTEKAMPVTQPPKISSTDVTESHSSETRDSSSEENSGSNEVITQETTKITSPSSTTIKIETTTELKEESTPPITEIIKDITTKESAKILTTVAKEDSTEDVETTTEDAKSGSDMEDLTNYAGEVTTEVSSRVLPEEAGSGAAVAIAVSTIGVIALILLVGLLVSISKN